MHLRDDKFLINCSARTGSTLLVHLLNSHPDAICHGEPFGPEVVGNIAGRYRAARQADPEAERVVQQMRDEFPERFLYDCVFDPQGRAMVGFKYKADESQDERHQHVTRILTSDRDIKVINLLRRDRVAQFVSHQVVLQQTGVTLLREGDPRVELTPLRLDPEQCVREVREAHERYKKARDAFGANRSYEIAYEDLLDADAQQALLAFLGLKPRPLESPTRKIINTPLEELVPNLSELRDAVASAGLG